MRVVLEFYTGGRRSGWTSSILSGAHTHTLIQWKSRRNCLPGSGAVSTWVATPRERNKPNTIKRLRHENQVELWSRQVTLRAFDDGSNSQVPWLLLRGLNMRRRRELLKIRLTSEWFVGSHKLHTRKRFKPLRIACSGASLHKASKRAEHRRVWVRHEGEDFFGLIVAWALWVVFGEEGEGSSNDLLRGRARKVGCSSPAITTYVSSTLASQALTLGPNFSLTSKDVAS